jgi:hypothetical protein
LQYNNSLVLELLIENFLSPHSHYECIHTGEKEPQPSGYSVHKHADKDLFFSAQNRINDDLRYVVWLVAILVLVVIDIVLGTVTGQCIDRHIGVYVAGLTVDDIDVLVRE